MSKRKHGGLAECLRLGRAPGIHGTAKGRFNDRDIQVPCVPRPPDGWKSAKEIDAACAARGIPGAMESEFVRNINASLREGPKSVKGKRHE